MYKLMHVLFLWSLSDILNYTVIATFIGYNKTFKQCIIINGDCMIFEGKMPYILAILK